VTELSVLKPAVLLLRKDPWYPFDRRLGECQSCSSCSASKDSPSAQNQSPV